VTGSVNFCLYKSKKEQTLDFEVAITQQDRKVRLEYKGWCVEEEAVGTYGCPFHKLPRGCGNGDWVSMFVVFCSKISTFYLQSTSLNPNRTASSVLLFRIPESPLSSLSSVPLQTQRSPVSMPSSPVVFDVDALSVQQHSGAYHVFVTHW